MSFKARAGQDQVLDATERVLLVLGGAGTGKTTTAAAVVRQILDTNERDNGLPGRALFLSFSNSAVGQIVDRTAGLLGPHVNHVEITTFHAFAWHLIRRWGRAVGVEDPQLMSPSAARLLGSSSGLSYGDLLPLALRICQIPAIRRHLETRWKVIVSDEFQDTSDEQFTLLKLIRGRARLLLLGDPNQCIYTNLPGVVGVGVERLAAALAISGSRQIELPDVSHRDPTNILPAAASAIRLRDFEHEAVKKALRLDMLSVRHHDDPNEEGPLVAALILEFRAQGHTIGVFSHHVDKTASLSDHLNSQGIAHEIVGLPDAISSALHAEFEMLRYAAGQSTFDAVKHYLAVFVTSVERGNGVPNLASIIMQEQESPPTFAARLQQLGQQLYGAESVREAMMIANEAHTKLGLTRGERTWASAATILRNSLSPRLLRAHTFPPGGLDYLRERLSNQHIALLTDSKAGSSADVQLMGLYQSKGREADATIVVFRQDDYFGQEPEPMQNGSKLLYVVLTRARKKTIVLTLGSNLPKLVAPLKALSRNV